MIYRRTASLGSVLRTASASASRLGREAVSRQVPQRRGLNRQLVVETLDERRLLAVGPQLIGVQPSDGALLEDGDIRRVAPRDLTFRFDEGQAIDPATLGGIRLTRSGLDGVFGDAADVVVVPGFLGVEPTRPNEVVMRFAEPLPDDVYRIDIFGSGASPLKNVQGDVFNNGVNEQVPFELDLGPQVIAVVPQPMGRNSSTGALTQARNQIVVYFNNDNLAAAPVSTGAADAPTVVNPAFYQLIFVGDTAGNADDVVHNPTSVQYDPVADRAVLTFSADLETLSGAGTYRLKVGPAEALPPAPLELVLADVGSSFATAHPLGVLGSQSQIVSAEIDPQFFPLDFPGAVEEPGHRDVPAAESHLLFGADLRDGATTIPYNFRSAFGRDSQGNVLFNVITAAQRARAREVLELYGHYLGVQFFETDGDGLTIATGDLRAVNPGILSAAGGFTALAGTAGPSPTAQRPTVVLDNAETWSDAYGGNWFQTAMRFIGRTLGMGDTSDLPPLTVSGQNDELAFGNSAEGVFPGDHDIVHGRHLHRPDSNDIDLYRFQIQSSGVLSLETIAERLTDSSLLDAHLTLFREVEGQGPQLVARNDDYFSEDSLIRLAVQPGIYYVAVTASGNDRFDPTIENTGLGGTSHGPYQLRFDFRRNVDQTIVDATGTALDGDADGVPGGAYNFWFRAAASADTIFVDKAHATTGSSPGTLANPYNRLDTALAAAQPGDIVRVVGNGGSDGLIGTLGNNLAYELGIGQFGVLADGSTLNVPRGVTMMVDGGALFKLRRTVVQTGSSSVTIDRSGGALQVLGTPEAKVFFTSYNDESIGVDTNPLVTTPAAGDWGGLIFRSDQDRAEGRFDFEQQGAFVNYVNHADIRYGGGSVSLNSIQQVITPIHLIDARPTISFNSITRSANAAISANPDSFEESTFNAPDSLGVDYQSVPFTADYQRVGPEIHGNRLLNNTTNGLFVRTGTPAGSELERMTVAGRFDDLDIVHVIKENLIVQGTPGGPMFDAANSRLIARTDAQLVVDPGIVVKLDGTRIEAQIGTQILAEGIDGRQVVFTSLLDTRYGAGGTFATSSSTSGDSPSPGDWGGIYAGPVSRLSVDYAQIAYGGGLTRIEGTFAGFNAIEIHQAQARITNSTLSDNASGLGGQSESDRAGRGSHTSAAIFVRGSQPVIAGNSIFGTIGPQAAAISINANALNHELVSDPGRSTGMVDRVTERRDNQGPLVRGNLLDDNSINGMLVRGATLTTESVWDDTDIVHVLFDEIVIPNFHTFGGLRLESSPTESLVVKLYGPDAGFHTTGRPSDIDDRIGGMLHVLGQPGRPVVLTSLADDSVGAGLDLSGQPQNDTDGGGRGLPIREVGSFNIDINYGPLAQNRPQIREAVEMAARIWERLLEDPITVTIDLEIIDLPDGTAVVSTPDFVNVDFNEVRNALIDDARAHESIVAQIPLLDDLNVDLPDQTANPFEIDTRMRLTRANALALGFEPTGPRSVFDPEETRSATIQLAIDPLLNKNSEAPVLFDYDRTDLIQPSRFDAVGVVLQAIGRALGFTSVVDTIDAALADANLSRTVALSPLDLFRLEPGAGAADFSGADRALDPATTHVFYDGGLFDSRGIDIPGIKQGDIPLSTGVRFGDGEVAGAWKDDKKLDGTYLGVMDPRFNLGFERHQTDADRAAFDLIGYDVIGGGVPGDWQGITLETYSHDRNVAVVLEAESRDVTGPGVNGIPETAQFLGALASREMAGDDNLRLGFAVQGLLNDRRDVDVFSFDAFPGTEIWLDIDRTDPSLDTVVELIDGTGAGTVLARSDNSFAEDLGTQSIFAQAGIEANPLRKSLFYDGDFWSTNPLDAGMRVVLPGSADTATTYHVRVRSSSSNLNSLTGGLTSGAYQLQVRLSEVDELPGTTVQFADIRYADDGIRVRGVPLHSPLTGEVEEDESNNDAVPLSTFPEWRFISSLRPDDDDNQDDDWEYRNLLRRYFEDADLAHEFFFSEPQRIGNVTRSDRGAISVSGSLDSRSITLLGADGTDEEFILGEDIDWYWFEVDVEGRDATNPDLPPELVEVIFDLDYADGLGRPDVALAVYQPIFGYFNLGDPAFQEPFGGVIDSTVPQFINVDSDVFFEFREDGRGVVQDLSEMIGAELVFFGQNSNDADDGPAPLEDADLEDLSRGTVGQLDPVIGPVALARGTYLVAVTSVENVPRELDQYTLAVARSDFAGRANPDSAGYFPASDFGSQDFEPRPRLPNNPFIRLEPIDTLVRVTENPIEPAVPGLLTDTSAVPYHLGDLQLFVSQTSTQPNTTNLHVVDPFTGFVDNPDTPWLEGLIGPVVGQFGDIELLKVPDSAALDFQRLEGSLFALTQGPDDARAGNMLVISAADASVRGLGDEGAITDDNIETNQADPDNPDNIERADVGVQFAGITFDAEGRGFGVGNIFPEGSEPIFNVLYMFTLTGRESDEIGPGEADNGPNTEDRVDDELLGGAMTNKKERGILDTMAGGGTGGLITGIAIVGNTMYAVDDNGGLFEVQQYFTQAARLRYIDTAFDLRGINFTGLTAGPVQTEGGRYAEMLFGIDFSGRIYAFDTSGELQPVFVDGQTSVPTGLRNSNGLSFSTLEENPWHISARRGSDPGHGYLGNDPYSFHFGEETLVDLVDDDEDEETPPVPIIRNYNFPAGAHGSVISNRFSLDGYSATDEPTLYFSYFLATESASGGQMRDSFRVFAADDTSQWTMLASNNITERDLFGAQLLFDNTWEDIPDPFDRLLRNGRRDPYTEERDEEGVPDEENGVWRQARISLGQFAGQSNLRLRFDFATGGSLDLGNSLTTGAELRAVDGRRITDGDVFAIDGRQFEFDLGYTLMMPTGRMVADQETITIGDGVNPDVTFEFDRNESVSSGNVALPINDSLSPSQLAQLLARAIATVGPAGVTAYVDGSLVNLAGATTLTQSAEPAVGVTGAPGAAGIAVPVHFGMTSNEVAEAMVTPLADTFAGGVTEAIKSFGDAVRIIGHRVTDPGPLGLANALPGDSLGVIGTPQQILSGQENVSTLFDFTNIAGYGEDNNFEVPSEGVYIDDLVIGFASRGERVFDTRPFVGRDYYLPENVEFGTRFVPGSVVEGEYQLEIRTAETTRGDAALDPLIDPRDRLSQAVTLFAPAGSDLADAQVFTISNGVITVTFEYEDLAVGDGVSADHIAVPFSVGDSAVVMAETLEGVINDPAVRSGLKLGVAADALVGSRRVNLFGPNVVVDIPTLEVIDTDVDGNTLRDALLGDGVTAVGDAVLINGPLSAGLFQGGRSTIGIESGIILTTGDARFAKGPNFEEDSSGTASGMGDADLDAEFGPSLGVATLDTTSLEFSFNLEGDDLFFSFVFASEEYNEFVGSRFNDVFAFFVDGENVALVPGTRDPISINTVNGGDIVGENPRNQLFFNNNSPGGSQALYPRQLGYDGFTDVLTATKLGLGPGIHTIKLAISDVGDTIYDSAVFIAADSFSSVPPPTEGNPGVVFDDVGSPNRERGQGQLLIAGNQIRYSGMYGIVVETPPRDLPTYFFEPQEAHSQFEIGDYIPHPGSTRNLEQINEEGLAPGVTITNNVVAHGAMGGIQFGGDPNGFVIIPPIAGEHGDPAVSEVWNSGGPPPLPAPFSFSVTDHNGLTVIFEFDTGDGVNPGHVPIVYQTNEECPNIVPGGCMPRYHWAVDDMTDLMMRVFATTNLDINIYRGKQDELYLEGVADIHGVTPGPNPPFDWFDAWNFEVAKGLVPFGRIVNNTIVGQGGRLTAVTPEDGGPLMPRGGFEDVGILIEDNAAPTVLNNIIVNFGTGVEADRSSQNSVLGANLYQGNFQNLRNVTVGDFAIQLTDTDPLFVDFDNGNFYLDEGTRAIDSSVDSLEERPSLVLVKEPMGIGLSPVGAPDRDGLGQLRVDDPQVEPPEGFGQNVFKDRGALDRADFIGPTITLLNPRDNDATGQDRDPTVSVVQLGNQNLRVFSLQFVDGLDETVQVEGTGIDANTVSGGSLTLVETNNDSGATRLLQEGIDYTFSYDTTNDTVRLIPLAGIWPNKRTYTITFDNSETTGVQDIAGNSLRPNQTNGLTRFTISLGAQALDFGDALDPTLPVLAANGGASHEIADGFFLGALVDAELDGQPSVGADGDGADEDGVTFASSFLILGTQTQLTVTASAAGRLDAWIDFNRDGDWNDSGEQIFTSRSLVGGPNVLSLTTPAGASSGTSYARFRFSSAGGLLPTGAAADGEVEDYVLTLGLNPWQNPVQPLNANKDLAQSIDPIDALVIINELNNRLFSDPVTGKLPVPPPVAPDSTPPLTAPFYYDVNGDGFATAIDALRVINFLNERARQQAAQQQSAGGSAVAAAVPEDSVSPAEAPADSLVSVVSISSNEFDAPFEPLRVEGKEAQALQSEVESGFASERSAQPGVQLAVDNSTDSTIYGGSSSDLRDGAFAEEAFDKWSVEECLVTEVGGRNKGETAHDRLFARLAS